MRLLIIALSLLAAVTLASASAEARPKKPCDGGNGCSCTQVVEASSTDEGSKCMQKGDQDAIAGRTLVHAFVCASTGTIYCCEVSGSGHASSCTRVSARSRLLEGIINAPPATMIAPVQ